MKKTAITIVMLLVLSIFAFADGEYPTNGKSCPNGQSGCLVSAPETSPKVPADNTVYKKVLEFLKSIFG